MEKTGLLTLGVLVAKGALAHVGEFDSTLGARVHEPVTARGVKLGSGDDLGQLFHVRGLNVHDVEALVLDIQVPQVNTKVVAADECLSVAVNGYAVDVVGVGVGIGLPRHSCDYGVVVGEAR